MNHIAQQFARDGTLFITPKHVFPFIWVLPGDSHYNDVIMTTVASQIISLTFVYSTVYSDTDQRKHQSSASLAFVWGIHRDRWIPRTNGQLRGKCFHLMTSSWYWEKKTGPETNSENRTVYDKFIMYINITCSWRSAIHETLLSLWAQIAYEFSIR